MDVAIVVWGALFVGFLVGWFLCAMFVADRATLQRREPRPPSSPVPAVRVVAARCGDRPFDWQRERAA